MTNTIIRKPYDCINVHSGFIHENRVLDLNTRLRVEHAAMLYKANIATVVLMNGGPGDVVEPGNEGTEAVIGQLPLGEPMSEAMAEYGVKLGIPRSAIITQDFSIDTVTEAFNAFVQHFAKGMEQIVAISNSAHLPRVVASLSLMSGDSIQYTPAGIVTAWDIAQRANEVQRYDRFRTKFGDITPHDLPTIEARIKQHYTRPNILVPNELRA